MSRNNPPIISFYTKWLKWRIRCCEKKASKNPNKSEKYTKKAELYKNKLAEEIKHIEERKLKQQ